MTIEQAICECTRKAEANRELAKYNKSHVDRANDLKNAKECEQLAAWLRELAERRKAPEIVRCRECKHASTDATCCLVCNREGMGLRPYHVHSDDYCSYAERRTDGENLPE